MRVNKRDWGLDDPKFKYINALETNVLETLKRHGWVPPSEAKRSQAKQTVNVRHEERKG